MGTIKLLVAQPPYLPMAQRVVRGAMGYLGVFIIVAILLQILTPFQGPDLAWELNKKLVRLIWSGCFPCEFTVWFQERALMSSEKSVSSELTRFLRLAEKQNWS